MTFPRYPDYKDSGVEWLGEVPAHWEICALKRVVSMKSGDTITSENIDESGEFPVFGGNGLRGYTNSYTHNGTYALIGRQGALCGNINYAQGKFWASEHAVVVSSLQPVETLWLGELLGAMNLNQYSISAAQPGLSVEIVGNLRIPFPPATEQQTIAAFLDRETAKIDALIAEQQRLIELLKEKRQAVISHAVTKGLNPDAPMKDSGIEWLGDVPKHWGVSRLKFLMADIKAGPFGSALTKDMYVNAGYRIYGQEQVIPNDFSVGDYYITEEKYQELKQYQVAAGDILISCVGTFGKIAIVPSEIEPGIINPRLMRLRCSPAVGAEYLVVLLRSIVVFEQFSLLSRGGTMDVINIGTLNEIVLPIPEIGEQETILRFVEREIAKVDALTAEAQRGIDLLKERRTALISAAVTGKIDVRLFALKEAA
jgi:type I restriction enzyme S subunit